MQHFYHDKRVFVTGACGTVGSELIPPLLEDCKVRELIAVDNNESEIFFLEQRYSRHSSAGFFLEEVRERDKLCRKMENIDVVFHTVAFKHLTPCERSPIEAVQVNIHGVQNVTHTACENHVWHYGNF